MMKVSMLKVEMKLLSLIGSTEEDASCSPSCRTPSNRGKCSAALPTKRDGLRLELEHDVKIL